MRTRTTNLAWLALGLLAALLLGAAPARAQQGQPARPPAKEKEKEKDAKPADKPTLEEALAQALKDNPDIRVAEAKLQEADAELNRTKLQVMQKVVALHADLQRARAKVAYAESQFKRFQQLHERKAVDETVLDEAQNTLAAAKAELASLEAQMPALLGKPPQKAEAEKGRQGHEAAVSAAVRFLSRMQAGQDQAEALGLLSLAAAQQAAPVPVAEKVRKALDTPVAVDFKDVLLSDVLKSLEDKTGILIRNKLAPNKDENPRITLKFSDPLPLRSVLQALEDEFPGSEQGKFIRFVVRDYGLLVGPPGSLPPGAILVDQLGLWQGAQASSKNPPAENVEGAVTRVDAKTGLITVSVGSDDGLEKGHTLEVFRLSPSAKYLGTVRVLETKPHEAVAQPVNRLLAPVQQGDKVASKVAGN
jgi:hypothetical protein